ncbi:hypothetical protein B0H21DRAFT_735021 [Amylocystis lapponica]|nr:hypothetical protein B0H21DRAFT_735021 [Amylocystis lapponica]
MAATLENELQLLLPALIGTESTRYLALASFMIYVYDYALTFRFEVKYFWTGSWSISRILFLINRYLTPAVLIIGLVCLFGADLSIKFCNVGIRATFIADLFAVANVQAIIVLRIWYIYSNRRVARLLVVAAFVGCTIASTVMLVQLYPDLHPEKITIPGIKFIGCTAPISNNIWKVFLPSLVLHTILYIATTWPAIRLRRMGRDSPLMNRLVRDGGIFYLVVFSTAVFTTVGALEKDNLSVLMSAIYSNFLLAIVSVSVSRLMLSIHSLAASLSMDSNWLLNNAELSRVRWRKGSRDGELIVEVDAVEEDTLELGDVKGVRSHTPVIRQTRVGVYDDGVLPGTVYPNRSAPRIAFNSVLNPLAARQV